MGRMNLTQEEFIIFERFLCNRQKLPHVKKQQPLVKQVRSYLTAEI